MKKFLEVLMDDDGVLHFSTDFEFPDSIENPPKDMKAQERENDEWNRKLIRDLVKEIWGKRNYHPSKAIRYLATAEMMSCAEPYECAEEFWSTMMFHFIPHYERYASQLKKPFGFDPSKMTRPVVRGGMSVMPCTPWFDKPKS